MLRRKLEPTIMKSSRKLVVRNPDSDMPSMVKRPSQYDDYDNISSGLEKEEKYVHDRDQDKTTPSQSDGNSKF